ncbi:MAG TPA: hypothetical protein PKD18_00930 [Saprospiraceae bacterium]|nr:hypothetical protein [Saprospiraceae bacterium]
MLSSVHAGDTIRLKKWEITTLFDPFRTTHFNLEQISDSQIDLTRETGGILYRSNTSFIFSRNIKNNFEILVGFGGIPKKGSNFFANYYYVGARFSKKRKFIDYRYASGVSYEGGAFSSINRYGLRSTISAAYIWKSIIVVSFEHNVSFIYNSSKIENYKSTGGLFMDDYPLLRLGIRL